MTTRQTASTRQAGILSAALRLAETHGYRNVTRAQIAEHLGITPQAVQHHISTVAELQQRVLQAAVDGRVACVVAQGLLAGELKVSALDAELKQAAAEWVLYGAE